MNKNWAKVEKATGRIFSEGYGFDPENLIQSQKGEDGYDVFGDRPVHVTGKDHYYDYANSTWEARPALPDWTNPYDLTALPVGTVVIVTDSLGTEYEITDLSEDLILEGPETYQFQVKPPFPYIPIRTTVEVA